MEQLVDKKDEIVMKLLHYFIMKQDYNPIILHGAKNEIWLENMEKDYKIVRIVSNYIHNDEQMDFDLFKTKQIRKQIGKKTLTHHLNVLNIYVNLGNNVNLESFSYKDMNSVYVKNITDFKNYQKVLEMYPNINNEPATEEGMDLFIKLSSEINKKTERETTMNEELFTLKKPVVTYALIAINVIVFVLMYLIGNGSTDGNTLVAFGANYGPLVKAGEYYRLLTSAFIHIGLLHIICNMYSLYIIGPQLESFFGKTKYLIIYLGGAVMGNLMALVMTPNAITAGASGAIFALLGALLYFGYHYRVYLGNIMRSQIIPLIVLNLAIGFMQSGISNSAHIGGLIGGIVLAGALGVPHKSTKSEKINSWIIMTILVGFLIYMGFIY